ncbi:MAG TPA: LutB/LldF family L-lactate oxidation iron-sulfur protein [Anaerolineales bacterium]|nr:LutB/LldF family L-lactate oxidation iron-sulfur protein [Anaerolineales bacterium]
MDAAQAFRERVRQAVGDANLQGALDRNAVRRRQGWEAAFAALPDAEAARREARRVRQATLENLDPLLAEFRRQSARNGVHVHDAATAAEACSLVVEIARRSGVRRVAKSKSILSEEIGLNAALERAGLQVVETDLGEFIVQLRGEAPSHITAPAIHLTRDDVGRTFTEHLGVPFTADIEALTALARRTLRKEFLRADMGVSGANFGVAQTGTLCLVTNEGNGRMVTTLPRIHVALMGMERLVPTLEDLARMLVVLPRAATGQTQTSYVTFLQTPRRPDESEGPAERHVILVDNGRLRMRATPMAEALLCIRCGACLNACPVYREIGGHAYASVYPGPIGSVVAPSIFGLTAFGHLARASTLCGACREACPVDIDLPRLLLELRHETVRAAPASRRSWRWAMRSFSWVTATTTRYRFALRSAALLLSMWPRLNGWIRRLPPPLSAWTHGRDFPVPALRPFRDRWRDLAGRAEPQTAAAPSGPTTLPRGERPEFVVDAREVFVAQAKAAGAEVVRTTREGLSASAAAVLADDKGSAILVSDRLDPAMVLLLDGLPARELEWVEAAADQDRSGFEDVPAGVTGVEAALADTGSLVLLSGEGRSLLASLLPRLHLAVVPASRIRPSLAAWLQEGGDRRITSVSQAVLVTGPSRTADIEMTLTVGVHGPGRLVILLVEDA